jgi:AraC-like DNA-binding protein
MSVSRAAARVGYQINSTFYRAFKRALGMSPSLYRRKAIETSGEGVIGTLHSPDIQPAAQHARAM